MEGSLSSLRSTSSSIVRRVSLVPRGTRHPCVIKCAKREVGTKKVGARKSRSASKSKKLTTKVVKKGSPKRGAAAKKGGGDSKPKPAGPIDSDTAGLVGVLGFGVAAFGALVVLNPYASQQVTQTTIEVAEVPKPLPRKEAAVDSSSKFEQKVESPSVGGFFAQTKVAPPVKEASPPAPSLKPAPPPVPEPVAVKARTPSPPPPPAPKPAPVPEPVVAKAPAPAPAPPPPAAESAPVVAAKASPTPTPAPVAKVADKPAAGADPKTSTAFFGFAVLLAGVAAYSLFKEEGVVVDAAPAAVVASSGERQSAKEWIANWRNKSNVKEESTGGYDAALAESNAKEAREWIAKWKKNGPK